MKILFLTLNAFDKRGGIQTFNKYFREALDDNGHSWRMVSFHDVSGAVPGKIYCCGSNLFSFVFQVLKLCRRDTVIVWNHISIGLVARYISPILVNRRNILLVYGTEVWHQDLAPKKKKALNFFDEIWAISNFTKRRLIENHGQPEGKFRIFPCCISTENVDLGPNPYVSSNFNILTLMRLDIEPKLQAVYDVLNVLPALLEEGIPAHFTVVGEGNGAEEVRTRVVEMGLTECVTFTGFVEDPNPYLQHCDVFSMVSSVEGFGIVYLEAMRFGKCCIAAKDCGSVDVVLDGVTGFTVSANDASALKAVFVKLAFDESLRRTLGEEGRSQLLKNYTFESFKVKQQKLLLEEAE